MAWGGCVLLCLWFAVEILRSRRQEQAVTAWLLLFILSPPVGVVAYLALGARKLRRRAARKAQPAERSAGAQADCVAVNGLDRLVQSHGLPAATAGNAVALRTTPATAYAAVLDLIDRAEETLGHDLYPRHRPGGAGDPSAARRAGSCGVQVRLLIDDVGSKDLRDAALAPLVAAGGRVERFMPASLIPWPRHYANLRNHRKIIIADRRRAWSGGMNLAEEYLGTKPVANRFRDLSFVIEGPAAAVYAEVFAADWLDAAGEDLRAARPWEALPAQEAGSGVVQVVPSGPEFDGDPLHDLLLDMAHRAQRRLWIVTPISCLMQPC
ncbi:PLDc N-terminal domain-containing protein [Siccirubricoccus deserti]